MFIRREKKWISTKNVWIFKLKLQWLNLSIPFIFLYFFSLLFLLLRFKHKIASFCSIVARFFAVSAFLLLGCFFSLFLSLFPLYRLLVAFVGVDFLFWFCFIFAQHRSSVVCIFISKKKWKKEHYVPFFFKTTFIKYIEHIRCII